jgi:hypothetical protein
MYKVGFLIVKGVEKMKKELGIKEAIEILKNNKAKKVIHKQLL